MAKILVAEDELTNQQVISRMLTLGGHTVIMTNNGQEALIRSEQTRPDLILMDMSMPVLDGWGAVASLKCHPRLARIPVIALTAHAMRGDRERTLKAGCDEYISKPFEYYDLMEKIERLVEVRQRLAMNA